ncbi:MAG: PilT protein domain protein [Thermoleophilia bacterium]|nr:PilT protein domain protein [Thermoleophilia bacterium]
MKVVLDTSAVLALLDADDAMHASARHIWEERLSASDHELVIPNYVVSECLSLVSRRLGMAAARDAHQLMTLATTLWTHPVEHATATRHFLRSGRALSFVDCVTFTIMEVRGVTTAFAFDDDFATAGFTTLTA